MSFIVVMDTRRVYERAAHCPVMYLCEPEGGSVVSWSAYSINVRRFASVADAVACIVERDLDHQVNGPLRIVDACGRLDHSRSR